jgi:hypothetical protein
MSDEDKNVLVGYPTGGDAYISKTVVEVVGLRDQFAMAALPVFLTYEIDPKTIAEYCYVQADAMMEARK